MVTSAQVKNSIGSSGAGLWESDHSDQISDDTPRPLSRPARLTIASVIGLALIGLALTTIGVIWKSSGEIQTVSLDGVPPTLEEQTAAQPAQSVQRTVIIHVIGQVITPGIVELDDGARVVDALEASGGVTPEADVSAINLARILTDGEQIYVPAAGEDLLARPLPLAGSSQGPISLSRADQAALETLPGVGPALAERIIAHRATHGPFQEVADLLAVSGIGPAILEKIAGQVIP